MTTLATHIARFTSALDAKTMPPEVVEKARACLLNAYGMGLDCHDTPYAPVARAAALALDGEVARRRDHARRRSPHHDRRRLPRQLRRCSMAAARRIPPARRTSARSWCRC